MTFQTIDTAEPSFPVNFFISQEDPVELGESDWLAIACCNYGSHRFLIDAVWETDTDE